MAEFTRTNGAQPGQDRTFPRFFMHQEQDHAASAREGRPIYREVEKVEIIMPGIANLTKPVVAVTNEYRDRWPKQYEAFKKGHEMAHDGTPLEQWPILNRSMVMELKALEIHTVEQVSGLSDMAIQRIGRGGYALREKAKAYLDEASELALVEKLSKQNLEYEEKTSAQDRKIEELTALVTKLHSDLMTMRDAPSPLATHIPSMSDPVEHARNGFPVEAPSPSALDSLAAAKRRPGRPPKAAVAA